MNTGDALLAAVLAEPADDLHRLAYADWCLENGPAWLGELIHFQMRNDDGGRSRWRIVPAGGQATSQWLCDWLAFAGGEEYVPPAGSGMVWAYRRGFVEEVECPLRAWLEHGPALARRQPVERVVVTDANPVDHLRPGEWWWWLTNGPAESHTGCDIPSYLWACLRKPPVRHYWGRRYNSEREAVDDLSAACLEWAKERGVTG